MQNNETINIPIKIKDSFWWMDKPYSKGQALLDLYLNSTKDATTLVANSVQPIWKGQIVTSKRRLAVRWGWSKNKVMDFLDILESENMITQTSNNKRTIISIIGELKDVDEGFTL